MKKSLWGAFLLVLSSCGGNDSSSNTDAAVRSDASADASQTADATTDGGTTCDCCGTTVPLHSDAGSCEEVCEGWCGLEDPCLVSCDLTANLCVLTFSNDLDAGTPTGTCVPRPGACADLGNCGGPMPDVACDPAAACFSALDCDPYRVAYEGDFVMCAPQN